MLHRVAIVLIVTASALVVAPVRASGDVPPDPDACPALYTADCTASGVCADVCALLCDGDDATDAGVECKDCEQENAYAAFHTCYDVMYTPPTCAEQVPGIQPCAGGEVEAYCWGDGVCEDEAAPACYACDPGGYHCLTYCGA